MNLSTTSRTESALLEREPREDDVPLALPADDVAGQTEHSALGLVELLLKNPARLDVMNRDERKTAVLIPRFLGVALTCYLLFAGAMILILSNTQAEAYPRHLFVIKAPAWSTRSAIGLVLAYNFGLVATTGICLPTFYFFALLAGVRLSMLQIVAQVVRCKATSALVLIGILPAYVAVVLGLCVFHAPATTLEILLYGGLILPFIAGLAGVHALYHAVERLAFTMPAARRCRRECFLRRLTVSWAACYTAMAPVMIYRIWEYFAAI
jgi:hypothetical protein